jgi:hypothetical protein
MRGWYSLKTQTYEAGLVTLVSAALIDPEGGDCSFPEPLPAKIACDCQAQPPPNIAPKSLPVPQS